MTHVISIISIISIFYWSSEALSKNDISYDKIPENVATGLDKFKCRGRFEKAGILNDIGYSDALLEKGVTCKKADFDGNGDLDYWIYNCDKNLTSCQSRVILMKKDTIKKVVKISKNFRNPDVIYAWDQKDHDYLRQFGCKLPFVDTLVEEGDGEGLENRVYKLNKQESDFLEVSHCKTVESLD